MLMQRKTVPGIDYVLRTLCYSLKVFTHSYFPNLKMKNMDVKGQSKLYKVMMLEAAKQFTLVLKIPCR